jgi:ubiquinone/menaquinone biosynthesis C-methylase UbiE
MTVKTQKTSYPSDVARYDIASRRRKAEKIRSILRDYKLIYSSPETLGRCLDIGCGPGIITNRLAQACDKVIGIDLDKKAILYGREHQMRSNLQFLVGSISHLPLPSQNFDTVICAQVYEHVPDPQQLVSEIWRVLKPGGLCFFSGPNRLAILEEHYFLPFLSWLPHPWADTFVRLSGRGAFYDANPWYLWQIERLWGDFQRYDYTLELIRRPQDFMMGPQLGRWSWVAALPPVVLRLLVYFLPNYNWVLQKPPAEGEV